MVFLIFIAIMLPLSILDYGKQTINMYYTKNYIFRLCLIYFIIVAGARYFPQSGGDWANYRGAFETSGKIGAIRFRGYLEPGFELLLNIIKTFSNRYIVFFITYEIIVCIFLYYNIKKYIGYPLTAICLYLPLFFFPLDLIQIRSLLAVQIFIFSIQFIQKRKMMSYFLCILCASTIHISSIILFPVYFILHRHFTNIFVSFIIFVGIMINILGIDIIVPILKSISSLIGGRLNERIKSYTASGMIMRRSIGVIHLEYIVFFIVFMMYRKKIAFRSVYSNIFFNMYILYGVTIFYFWGLLVLSGRMKFFFVASIVFFIPHIIILNKKYFIFYFCFIGYVLAMVIYIIYFQKGLGGSPGFFLSYRNYFFL